MPGWGAPKNWAAVMAKPVTPKPTPPPTSTPSPSLAPSSAAAAAVTVLDHKLAPEKLEDVSQDVGCVVLDSGAIISGAKVDRLGPNVQYYTIPEVIDEIRDEKSRQILAAFPYQIKMHSVSPEAMRAVRAFARKTGDLHALSIVDLKVLALTYTLEKKFKGIAHLRTEPVVTHQQALQQVSQQQSPVSNTASFAGDIKVAASFTVNDLLSLTAEEYTAKFPDHVRPDASEDSISLKDMMQVEVNDHSHEHEHKHTSAADAEATSATVTAVQETKTENKALDVTADTTETTEAVGETEAGWGDDEGEWITPANLHLQDVLNGSAVPLIQTSGCACITTDFAMQNVLLQMGLRLISIAGFAVHSVAAWILRCYGCYTRVDQMWRQFCPECGGNYLSRIRITVDSKGRVREREHNRKKYSRRGIQFSIPKPKGGRGNKDLQFREDTVYDVTFLRHKGVKAKSTTDWYSQADMFGMNTTGKEAAHYKPRLAFGDVETVKGKIGYGNTNPNEVRRRGKGDKNRRRNRRRR